MQRGCVRTLAASLKSARERAAGSAIAANADGGCNPLGSRVCAAPWMDASSAAQPSEVNKAALRMSCKPHRSCKPANNTGPAVEFRPSCERRSLGSGSRRFYRASPPPEGVRPMGLSPLRGADLRRRSSGHAAPFGTKRSRRHLTKSCAAGAARRHVALHKTHDAELNLRGFCASCGGCAGCCYAQFR